MPGDWDARKPAATGAVHPKSPTGFVSEQWVRFGGTDMKRSRSPRGARPDHEAIRPTGEELALIRRLLRLSEDGRQLVEAVIEQFSPDGEFWKE
jgi:HTH-type transcriptional regulator, cell division transcriptional repressor